MVTLFGKFVRKLRIDNSELLKNMANKLSVTSSYLSAVENGKRNVPREWIDIISEKYQLSTSERKELVNVVEQSQLDLKVDLRGLDSEDKSLVLALARRFNELDNHDKNQLKSILLKKE